METAITKALENLQSAQKKVQSQLESTEGVAAIENPQQQREKLEEYSQLVEEIFQYLFNHYSFDRSEPLIHNLLSGYSDSPRLQYYAGIFYRIHGKPEESVKYFTIAIRLSSRLEKGHLALAEHQSNAGDIKSAIRSYERVLSINSQNAQAYNNLIHLHRRQETLNKLCDKWMARYRANSENNIFRKYLIEVLHKAGRFEEAQNVAARK